MVKKTPYKINCTQYCEAGFAISAFVTLGSAAQPAKIATQPIENRIIFFIYISFYVGVKSNTGFLKRKYTIDCFSLLENDYSR